MDTKTWLKTVFAIVEYQLSLALFGTESDIKNGEVKIPQDIKNKFDISNQIKERLSSLKKRFDSRKKIENIEAIRASNMNNLVIYKPIWYWILDQVDELYVFPSMSIFLGTKIKMFYYYTQNEIFRAIISFLLGFFSIKIRSKYEEENEALNIKVVKTPILEKYTNKSRFFEKRIKQIIGFVVLFSVLQSVATIVGHPKIGVLLSILCLSFIVAYLFIKKATIKFIDRNKILKSIFPKKRSLNIRDLIKTSEVSDLLIDLSRHDETTCFLHRNFLNMGLKPAYAQFGDCISIQEKQRSGNPELLIKKKKAEEPLIWFEIDKDDIVIIPYQTSENEVMRRIMETINLSEIDSIQILKEYLQEITSDC